MAPSFNVAELEVLIGIAGVSIFVALFLALLFCTIIGLGIVQALYIGGRYCVREIQESYSLGTRTMKGIGRIVPHH
jgi:hypothetical protein